MNNQSDLHVPSHKTCILNSTLSYIEVKHTLIYGGTLRGVHTIVEIIRLIIGWFIVILYYLL